MSNEAITIRPYEPRDAAACARVLGSIPEWFGFESANQEYLASLDRLPASVAEIDGEITGFIALEEQTESAAEIHVPARRFLCGAVLR